MHRTLCCALLFFSSCSIRMTHCHDTLGSRPRLIQFFYIKQIFRKERISHSGQLHHRRLCNIHYIPRSFFRMRAAIILASVGSALFTTVSCLPPASLPDSSINQPWTVTDYTASGPDGQEVATFRVTAPDNYVTGVRGLDVLCERVPYALEWDTVCASDETFRLEVNPSYQESYPKILFKLNHVQIDAKKVTIVTGEDFVLPSGKFEIAVDTVAIGL
ncbi:hypothetical protein F4808DRAFT_439251 [Astrocystis sublimbata]|nr:hypothetical protein F4808DRAFT_439251 [Astrocystis sublimbata]